VDEQPFVREVETVETPQWSGGADAVAALFFTHYRRLVGLATLLVDDRQAAEDVVQEAFAGLYRRWRQLRDPGAAITYLNRAVVNAGRDHLRQRRRATAGRLALVPDPEALPSAEHDAIAHDEADRLWRAICELPHRQRQVIVLRYYLDQHEAEIADTLRVSRGSVKKHASRGLAALARCLEATR
jgi:RNA polymerase sigma-70 factor (sigma-E family)